MLDVTGSGRDPLLQSRFDAVGRSGHEGCAVRRWKFGKHFCLTVPVQHGIAREPNDGGQANMIQSRICMMEVSNSKSKIENDKKRCDETDRFHDTVSCAPNSKSEREGAPHCGPCVLCCCIRRTLSVDTANVACTGRLPSLRHAGQTAPTMVDRSSQ